jgi:hypothetical protein
MSSLLFELLDPSSDIEREKYERAFYEAFERAAGNRLIRKLWIWDDGARKLRTRIPYEDQFIYVLRDSAGDVVTGLGVNHVMNSFQSSSYGFDPPQNLAGCCEFLTAFSVREYRLHTRFKFWRDSFADLHARGFHTAYATTARRVLNLYLYLGGRILEEREIEGEMRYFLVFDLGSKKGPGQDNPVTFDR